MNSDIMRSSVAGWMLGLAPQVGLTGGELGALIAQGRNCGECKSWSSGRPGFAGLEVDSRLASEGSISRRGW
ncbi:MAG: hypothetical protein ACLP7Q_18270 [Isosphaeraceae bacterium]